MSKRQVSFDDWDDAAFRARLAPLAATVLPNVPRVPPAAGTGQTTRAGLRWPKLLAAATAGAFLSAAIGAACLYLPAQRSTSSVPATAPGGTRDTTLAVHLPSMPGLALAAEASRLQETAKPPAVPDTAASLSAAAPAAEAGAKQARTVTAQMGEVAQAQQSRVSQSLPQSGGTSLMETVPRVDDEAAPSARLPAPPHSPPMFATRGKSQTPAVAKHSENSPAPTHGTAEAAIRSEVSRVSRITLPETLLQALLRRGDAELSLGDVAAARMLYERAANAGSADAARDLASTYDAAFLHKIGAHGVEPDEALAAAWLRRADELGAVRAKSALPVAAHGRGP